jgi:hypothetical protein
MAGRLWGRLRTDLDVQLRRGAWYKVLKVEGLEATIEVNLRPYTILKGLLELSAKPPVRWTVVPVPQHVKHAPAKPGESYGVCPSCTQRAALPRRAERYTCPRCRRDYAVAWDERYLDIA